MNYTALKNTSDKDILNYRIEEQMFNDLGEQVFDSDNQPRKTGQTLEWSIKAGETLEFPDYVANYLVGIYPFLEVHAGTSGVTTKSPSSATEPSSSVSGTPMAKSTTGSVRCPKCGSSFKNLRALGLHYAVRHPESLQ